MGASITIADAKHAMLIPQVRRQGSVQLDAREDSKGKMQTRFLIVQVIDIHFRF